MSKNEIMNNATRAFSKIGFKLKKASPEIMVITGVIGTVVGTVMACKATTKAGKIVEEHNEEMEKIHIASEYPEEYTEKDKAKDTVITYAKTAGKFIKLYGPSVAVSAASIGCILGSHHIMKGRNVALAAAYATIDSSFKDYRDRVVKRFGEELDKELRYNIKAEEIKESVVDENGKKRTVKTTVNSFDPNMNSDYARFFDDGCTGWSKDPEFNLMFLKQQQNYANEKLKSRGYLFLNEVYDMLGIPRTKAGQVVGWIYDEKNPIGDNFVDFGIYNVDDERKRAFVNGFERSILLDFNVDGNILENF